MFASLRRIFSFLGAMGQGVGTRHLGLIAAGVAFYGLLAIFPALTAIVTLWGFFADPVLVEQQFQSYSNAIPAAAFGILETQVNDLATGPKEVLGWASVLSIGTALWASRAGVGAMIGGLNAVHRTPPRGGLRSVLRAILLTLVLVGVALVALATVVVTPVVVSILPLGPYAGFAVNALRWLIGAGVVLLGIGLLYRLGPNREDEERSDIVTTGSIIAVACWALASWGFSTYLENFGRYNEVYGSLGAVVAMLMWFYFSAFIVLLGALTNAILDQMRDGEESPDPAADTPPDSVPDDVLPPETEDGEKDEDDERDAQIS
jgi:membrane protein